MRDRKCRAWYEKSQTWVYFNIGKSWTMLGHETYEELCLDGCEFYEFTGLKDKDRKEIYEGDILQSRKIMYSDDEYEVGEVVFNTGAFMIRSVNLYTLTMDSSFAPEVIGNICEDKSLLK